MASRSTSTYVESREELVSLLQLAGYISAVDPYVPFIPASALSSRMEHPNNKFPEVELKWINGCKIKGVNDFLTFTEAWEVIRNAGGDN